MLVLPVHSMLLTLVIATLISWISTFSDLGSLAAASAALLISLLVLHQRQFIFHTPSSPLSHSVAHLLVTCLVEATTGFLDNWIQTFLCLIYSLLVHWIACNCEVRVELPKHLVPEFVNACGQCCGRFTGSLRSLHNTTSDGSTRCLAFIGECQLTL